MAIRQYIGARYVPRFCGEWNNTTQYEALDVVDNGAGTSYIARKNVPVGTVLTNTDYWFIYGASSGAILALQRRIDAAEKNITEIKRGIWTRNEIKEKNVIMIGDSWGVTDHGMTNNWIMQLTPYFHTVYSNAHGGYSFNKPGASFITLFDALTIPTDERIDGIIAIGGANTTASGETTAFINHVKNIYPDAEIIIGTNGPQYCRSMFYNRTKMIEKEAMIAGCYTLCNLWQTTAKVNPSNWTSDYYHLIEYTEYAANIISYLINKEFAYKYNYHGFPVFEPSTDALANYFKDMNSSLFNRCDDHSQFMIRFVKGTNYTAAAENINLVQDQQYDVGTIPITMALTFYDNTSSGIINHGIRVFRNDYIDIYFTMPNDQPFIHIVVVGRQTGSFPKGSVFNDAYVLDKTISEDLFDFKYPSINDQAINMITFTSDNVY